MISIIIPTLNEERLLPSLLDAIVQQRTEHEVIVVDGGSQDRTLDIAGDHGVRTLLSPPGRGNGICVGANEAVGDVLFFLHADSILFPGALYRIDEVLSADAEIIGGNFRLIFDGDTPFSRWLTRSYARLRSIGLYYGDSGIFVRRSVYQALGGFRPMALMEDVDFVRRLERFGQTCCIKDPPLITSSRRFERRPPLQMLRIWIRLHVLLWLGVSPDQLARIYAAQAPRPETVGTAESSAKSCGGSLSAAVTRLDPGTAEPGTKRSVCQQG
jgi:rSAM/selenodomain-associated transferase 2